MRAISAVVGSTVWFDRELCAGCVVGSVDVDIDEYCDGNVCGFFLRSRTEVAFNISCLPHK